MSAARLTLRPQPCFARPRQCESVHAITSTSKSSERDLPNASRQAAYFSRALRAAALACQHSRRHVAVGAAVTGGNGLGAAGNADAEVSADSLTRGVAALYRFSRPHTMLGTTISVVSISLMALQGRELTSVALGALGTALWTALLMNISIVGINQIFDVEIDKVNKPDLPLASGELSMDGAIGIVGICTAASLLGGWLSGSPPLVFTLCVSLALGVVYSADLPFMRWKRSPLLAASCILAVRALIVQLGFFYHIKFAIGSTQLVLTPPLLFTVGFMLFFSIVIAFFKDIPDAKGDDMAGLRTLTVRYGVERVFWICIGLLTAAYASAVGFQAWSWFSPGGVATSTPIAIPHAASEALGRLLGGGVGAELQLRAFMAVSNVIGHVVLASALWKRALKAQLKKKQELVSFYMFIWKLFYAEYLLIPLLQA